MSDTTGTVINMDATEGQDVESGATGASPVVSTSDPVVQAGTGTAPISLVQDDPSPVYAPVLWVEDIDAKIREWLLQYIHGSAVSRNTEAYSHLVGVLPDLRNILIKG